MTLQIAVAGDVVLLSPLGRPTASLLPVLAEAEVSAANLEVVLTADESPVREGLTLRGEPALLDDLAGMGLDAVGLANNHAGDHGWERLRAMAAEIESRGIRTLGTGENAEAAFAPRLVGGVALVAATCVAPASFLASERGPGMAGVRVTTEWEFDPARTEWEPGWPPRAVTGVRPDDAARLLAAVRRARELSPRVAVLVHWGVSHRATAETYQRRLARDLAGAGASAVFGCHAHTLQGIEVVDGVPVFHGLGSLVFGYRGPGAAAFARDAAIALVDLDREGRATRARLLVGRLDERGEPVRAHPERVERVRELLQAAGADWGAELRRRDDVLEVAL
ncbi:MAG TPA: CapA family protein [Candidatus Dormibacteraeota bacterium]|nr:CapA family protein [Candidatus Dormibacteraeota bacterium]